ncbi:MAG: alpha/beta fold hydrolase [Sphingomonadales bacterium]|nr:alpha/beta fold hydrolase [Sphingomonadales bacterium]
MQAAGFAVLAFDHPCFGLSGGEPRGEVDPPRQLRAWRDAVSFVRTLDGLDGDRIGLWGSSFSGGHVIQAGALDPRIAVSSLQAPFVAGWDLIAGRDDAGRNFVALLRRRTRESLCRWRTNECLRSGRQPELPCAFPGGLRRPVL